MACVEPRQWVSLTEKQLTSEEEAQVRAHASTCNTCRGLLAIADGKGLNTGETRTAEISSPALPKTNEVSSHIGVLQRGTTFGRFVLLDVLGVGGMAVVYSAYDPQLDRKVALKLLSTQGAPDPTGPAHARMLREAQAMARLSHPNVVNIFEVGEHQRSIFIAMELVPGTTLREWLRSQPRSWQAIVSIFDQAGRGLAAAHAAHLIHRDFKPANVLIGEDGRARVTDFGIARADGTPEPVGPLPALEAAGWGGALFEPLTQADVVVGTVGYMSPEQALALTSDPRTDQFSFCVSLWEALYGQKPFTGATLVEVTRKLVEGTLPPKPNPSVPSWLHAVLVRGLARDPDGRFPSMDALLTELSRRRLEWKKLAVWVSAAALLTLGLLAWPQVRASECHRETDRRGAVWNDEARHNAERAFRGTGLPFAEMTWAFARATLDSFTTAWLAERHAACDQTLRTGERSEHQLELRLKCLERRHIELQTLGSRFQSADAEVVTFASTAVARLTPVAHCANVQSLESRAQLPQALQRVVDEVEQQLAEGRMLVALGRYDEARTLLTRAVTHARGSGDPQATALALFELGALEQQAHDHAASRTALEEALTRSLSIGDDRTALQAVGLLVSVLGWRMNEAQAALVLVAVGRGLVSRVADPALEALLDEGEGDARWSASQGPAALAAYQRALPLFERAEGPLGIDVARMHSSIGWMLMEGGRLRQAREAFEHSRRIREALLGSDHPALAQTWNELGTLADLLDDLPGAEAAFRKAGVLRRATPGLTVTAIARPDLNLANVLIARGRLDEAERLMTQYGVTLKKANVDSVALVEFEIARARLLLASGDAAGALATASRALKVSDRGALSGARALRVMAPAQLALGRPAEALTSLDLALERHQGKLDTSSTDFARLLTERAALILTRGTSEQARLATDRALAVAVALDGSTRLIARAQLLVAQARWNSEQQEQALHAAEAALELATLERDDELARAAAAFLAAHPAR